MPILRSINLTALLLALLVCTIRGDLAAGEPPADKAEEAFFADSVLPLLQKRCYECHSHASGKAKGGLVLDSRSGWRTGGDSGPAIKPKDPDQSLLIQAVRYGDLKMPPTGKLPDEEIAILVRWVAQGAFDPRTTAAAGQPDTADFEARTRHWAFQPVKAVAPPRVDDADWPLTDVDRFVLSALQQRGLRPAPEADRATWLRRVSFDLVGLPPAPEELADFLADQTPRAHERVVDRLLASPAFGERWARHWLDLVGYADQIGTANDVFAEHAWRYRDYVIQAINEDKPIDRFYHEQIAGDLLPYEPGDVAARAANLTATGFLLLGDLTIVEADKLKLRIDTVDQQVEKVGRAMLGMTLGCARCHDHKFDPITQQDYYALAGIFDATESIRRAEWGVWSFPAQADLPETSAQAAQREAAWQQHQQRVAQLRSQRQQAAQRKAALDEALKKDPPPDEPARAQLEKEQKDLEAQLRVLDAQLVHAAFFTPRLPRVFAVRDLPEPQNMHITIRGNPHALGEMVPRGFPRAIEPRDGPRVAQHQSGRLQLAQWITSPKNPLTARVAVNRMWQKLFGEGLVRSVDYFGLRGEAPTHPELLDFLAGRLVQLGWSRKHLLRELVLCRTYRTSSQHDPAAHAADPGNLWLWRAHRRRLDAEALRDAMLAVSGRLVMSGGGPGLPLEYLENTGGLAKGDVNPPHFRLARFRPEQEYVRTVYLPVVRSAPQAGPAELRNVFDFTQPAEFAGRRAVTTVPTQALFLMNSKMLKSRARELAQRVLDGAKSEQQRLSSLWLLVYNRPISDAESSEGAAFLAAVREELGTQATESPDQRELRAWAELCHALLSSNEFLIVM